MSDFRPRLLTQLTGLCRQLYDHRRALVEAQGHVSPEAKADIVLLVVELDRLRRVDPFPPEARTDTSELDGLKDQLATADGDPLAVQAKLMEWVKGFAGEAAEDGAATAAAAAVSPINQRMLDLTFEFRQEIDRARRRLTRDRDRFDLSDYQAARNAYTLARTAYDERLRHGQLEATNAEAAELQNELIPRLGTTDGAGFPAAIRRGADFISARLFAETDKPPLP